MAVRRTITNALTGELIEEKTLPQLAGTLLKEAGKWAKHGFPVADDTTQAARLNECLKCPYFVDTRCQKCGCFMRAKVKLETAKCPDGRW
jgi:hypothetical protein